MSIANLIDHSVYESADRRPRPHLGGSMIGRKCERELWYIFRWAHFKDHSGRMLRLFARGQREEDQFVEQLRSIGCEVREFSQRLMYHAESDSYMTLEHRDDTVPPTEPEIEALCNEVTHLPYHRERAAAQGVKLRQWRIKDVGDHFAGSLDGIAKKVPGLEPETSCLVEFKTHNTKSFTNLVALKSVREAKPEHWAQMQIYMLKKELTVALYMAVNKNDDDLYTEFVAFDREEAEKLIVKADRVIGTSQPPNRIGRHPSYVDCKFCDFKGICHYGEPMNRNCRTCIFSAPVDGGEWFCNKWQSIIPSDAILAACDQYKVITD